MRHAPRLVVAALTALTLSSRTRADEKVYQQTLPSTVVVLCETDDGVRAGSGVVVDQQRKWILTNYHVVLDERKPTLLFPTFDREGQLITERSTYIEQATALRRQGRIVEGRVIARELSADLALIELEELPKGIRAIQLASDSPRPGQRVHSIGNPGASDGLWLYSQGHVRAVYRRNFVVGNGLKIRARIVETQSPVNAGDSGGPVVNDRGDLVALVESIYAGGPGSQAQLLSTFIDISEIKNFLKNHAETASRRTSAATNDK